MIQVVFQNSDFIVCDKPAMVLSVPARDMKDPRPCLGITIQKELHKKIYPVHRLDFEVSGLIMYAFNEKSHRMSQDWFQKKIIHKKYVAKTRTQDFSHWPPNISHPQDKIEATVGQKFVWHSKIVKGKRRSFAAAYGDAAETHAEITGFQDSILNWILEPVTGKSHQLRFELSQRGFPILGDQLYGSKVQYSSEGIALRSVELDFSEISADKRAGLPEHIKI